MDRIKIAQLYADADTFGGASVTVAGWVKSIRDMKNFGFVRSARLSSKTCRWS